MDLRGHRNLRKLLGAKGKEGFGSSPLHQRGPQGFKLPAPGNRISLMFEFRVGLEVTRYPKGGLLDLQRTPVCFILDTYLKILDRLSDFLDRDQKF